MRTVGEGGHPGGLLRQHPGARLLRFMGGHTYILGFGPCYPQVLADLSLHPSEITDPGPSLWVGCWLQGSLQSPRTLLLRDGSGATASPGASSEKAANMTSSGARVQREGTGGHCSGKLALRGKEEVVEEARCEGRWPGSQDLSGT